MLKFFWVQPSLGEHCPNAPRGYGLAIGTKPIPTLVEQQV